MRFSPLRHILIAAAALFVVLALLATPASAVSPPKVTAALGDSITRAFNTEINPPTCPTFSPAGLLDCPKNSWSTGTNPAVNSQFQRIQAIDPGRNPVAFNDSRSGARAVDLLGQAQTAVTQDPDYVTVLIGANDACRSTIAQQTPTATFRSQVQSALDTLVNGDPKVYIQVVSIPDINLLRTIFTNPPDPNALTRWSAFNVCQALLANPLSNDQADVDRRAAFRAQVVDYNAALADVCAQYKRCLFDGNAGFNTTFSAADVATVTNTGGLNIFPFNVIPVIGPGNANSTADYFHPSLQGQAKIANVTWASTFSFN
jgi:lysophospholipase L1-like esterase